MSPSSTPKAHLVEKGNYGTQSSQMSFSRMLSLSLILVFPLTISGMSTSYPAVALPQLKFEMGHASYFGSVLQFTAPFGALMVGCIIDKYGRRSALLFSIIPSIVGWFIQYLNLNVWSSIAGQMLNGLMSGAVGYPSQVYAGECIMVNDVSLRNSFLSWISISNAFGMFLVYVLGYFITFQGISIVASFLSVVSFALTYFCIPESPSWLHLQGRAGDAEWSEKKLGLCNPLLENVHPHHSSVACENLELSPSHTPSIKKIKRKDVWKPLLLGSVLSVLVSVTGGMPVLTYMVQVIDTPLNETSGSGNHNSVVATLSTTNLTNVQNDSWSSNLTASNHTSAGSAPVFDVTHLTSFPWANNLTDKTVELSGSNSAGSHILSIIPSYGLSIISGALILIANVLMSLLLPYFGVKNILIYPLLGTALGMLVEGLTTDFKSDSMSFFIHVGAIWMVTFSYSFSLLIIPDAMLGDLFPVDAKGFASIPYLLEGFVTAIMCKAHPHLYDSIGSVLFYFYSFICLITAVFVSLFIPEIVGRTLKQINEGFL